MLTSHSRPLNPYLAKEYGVLGHNAPRGRDRRAGFGLEARFVVVDARSNHERLSDGVADGSALMPAVYRCLLTLRRRLQRFSREKVCTQLCPFRTAR